MMETQNNYVSFSACVSEANMVSKERLNFPNAGFKPVDTISSKLLTAVCVVCNELMVEEVGFEPPTVLVQTLRVDDPYTELH